MSFAAGAVVSQDTLTRRDQNKILWSYSAIVAFALFTALLVLGHGGSLLQYAYPLLAACLGGALFYYRRSTYFAYSWWIWLISPEIRRLVDFQTSYHSISPIMVTPLAVTGFSFLAIMLRPRILLRRSMLPFMLFALVTALAFVVGVFSNGPLPAAYAWATWLEPLFFGILLMADSRKEENRAALMNAILVGLLVEGVYGIYQFFALPGWDATWLRNSQLASSGEAYAEQVRIWGTLNDYGVFAIVLVASLVFILVSRGWLRVAGAAAGFPALALAQARAAWGIWVIAVAAVLWRMGGKSRLRITVFAIIVAAIAVPILSVGPVANIVSKRFATLSDVQKGDSAQAREALYSDMFVTAFSKPIGQGFGAIGVSAKLSSGQNADFDSGLLALPLTFGWVGGLVFLWSLGAIVKRMLVVYLTTKDKVSIAACGLFFGMMADLIFGQVFAGGEGMILWIVVALALGAPVTQRRKIKIGGLNV